MKKYLIIILILAFLIALWARMLMAQAISLSKLEPGSFAPAFSLKDTSGKQVSLGDFKGKIWCWNGPVLNARLCGGIMRPVQ